MEDLDVRSALTAYVTGAEPPIGLDGDAVLALGRRSRRTRLLAASVAALVVVLALGLAVVAAPRQSEIAGQGCPAAASAETRDRLVDRLSCVLGRAVRAMLAPGVRIERLTIPGETPPPDPFHLVADPVGDGPREALFHMGVRLIDERGAGSLYFMALPGSTGLMPKCATPGGCSVEQRAEGALQVMTGQENGVLTHRATLDGPELVVQLWSNTSGVLVQGKAPVPVQRPEPPFTLARIRELALTPGLGS
jgi:hypothetical protein